MKNTSKLDIEVDKILSEYQKQIEDFKKINGYYEQISTLLLTHLYIENYINLLIEKYFLLKTKILKDSNRYTFSVKLDLIYEKEFIPKWLYTNISKLNKIRNQFSHNLHFDILNSDLQFTRDDEDGELEVVDLKNELIGSSKDEQRNNLIIMQIPTLTLIILAGYIRRMQKHNNY